MMRPVLEEESTFPVHLGPADVPQELKRAAGAVYKRVDHAVCS